MMNHLTAVLCVALSSLILHTSAEVVVTAKFTDDTHTLEFHVKKTFTLRCNISGEPNLTVEWRKNNIPVKELLGNRWEAKKSGIEYSLTVRDCVEDDAGPYSCVAISTASKVEQSATIHVVSKIYLKIPSSVNVVEEEKLHLKCVSHGKPHPDSMHWEYTNDTSDQPEILTEGDRYQIEYSNGTLELTVDKALMLDRGNYTCVGEVKILDKEFRGFTIVRIIDKYAALWPFLGICAEVFFLCAIIFIYEKKRNKTELEESDTDQSPDQKNTPDHGKETNLRHRQ